MKLTRQAENQPFRIGWLTPLLAVFVILDLLSFWLFAWPMRSFIQANTAMVLGVVVFSSAYFLASRLVFPSNPEKFVDLDVHYLRVHRIVFAMLILMVVVQWLYLLSIPVMAERITKPYSVAMTAVLLTLMVAAAVTGNRKASIALLALLIARYLVLYLI